MSGNKRRGHGQIDAQKTVADAMKQVEKAMKQVKAATRGMNEMSVNEDGAQGMNTKVRKDGSVQIEKGEIGKKTTIHIHNSKNVQVGDNNLMVINQTVNPRRLRRRRGASSSSDSSAEEDEQPVKPVSTKAISEEHSQILNSERLAGEKDIKEAVKFIGKQWRRIGRSLQVDDTDLEQIYLQNFREQGIRGVGYEMLQKWKQQSGRRATVGALTTALCNVQSPEEVLKHFNP